MAGIGSNSGLPTLTKEDKTKIKSALNVIDKAMTEIAAEREEIKEIITKVSTETGIDKKLLRKLAKTFYNRSFNMDVTDNKNFESVYRDITEV